MRIVTLGLVLLAGWRLLLATTAWRADFAENNYQQNLLRIEGLQQRIAGGNPPGTVLAGTSITGRLLPAFFDGTPLAGAANLGLDGMSPAFALELLTREKSVPKRVFLETYVLHKSAATNEQLVRDSLASPAGWLAAKDPLFRTETRPSTLLYSRLKRGRESTASGKPARNSFEYWTNAPAPGSIDRLANVISNLQSRGCEVILTDLPVGSDWPPSPNMGEPAASELVRRLHLRRLDPRQVLRSRGTEPRFTDGVHLDGPSARETAQALAFLATP